MKRGLVKILISASDRFSEVDKPIKMTASITLRGANDSLKPSNTLLFELRKQPSNVIILLIETV